MNLKKNILVALLTVFFLCVAVSSTTRVSSFRELAEAHCQSFPIELFYRLSTGQLAEIYGKEYKDLDCYIRQFVNKDGQDVFEEDQDQEDQDSSDEEQLPENDPIVLQYAPGLKKCLPEGTNQVQAVYALWRFFRFMIQHDYTLEWMRAKVRASLGYEAEKPSAWMDGEQSGARLRLDKLFSNQFYDYVDKLMFRDFLHPIITFFRKNVVFAASGAITQSGRPILMQYIENKNLMDKVFEPVVFAHDSGNIFAYTIPGIPLLLAGSSKKVSWAFTGVLVDRSNIEQIETLGNKFYHHDSEIWIKLDNTTLPIKIKGEEEPFECKFVHSTYGTLYDKHQSLTGGKVSEYIARWHEKEKKVRVLFSQLFDLIINDGQTTTQMEFPFNSLVLTNNSGIFQYICPQKHPSYFLYPDLAGQAQPIHNRWVSSFKRNFLVVSNTHLTTKNQESYIKKDVLNPTEEEFLIETRRKLSQSKEKFTIQKIFDYVIGVSTDPLIKKRKDVLIHIYRKAKFLFFPEEDIRKECDQIIAMLDRWDHNMKASQLTPAFILWDYFFKDYTFNYVSSDPAGAHIAKHKVITEVYWTNQAENWKPGTSYGECDSDEWNINYRDKLNGTGENSTCFFNILRGINRTRQILRSEDGKTMKIPKMEDFVQRKIKDLKEGYVGTPIQEAFGVFFSKNIAFAAEIDNPKVIYYEGYLEERKELSLDEEVKSEPRQTDQRKEEGREQLDTEL